MSKVGPKWIMTLNLRPWTLDVARHVSAGCCECESAPPGRRNPALLERAGHLREVARAANRGGAVRLLRRSADGQRHAAPRPLPDAGDQGPLPALSNDARQALRAQS